MSLVPHSRGLDTFMVMSAWSDLVSPCLLVMDKVPVDAPKVLLDVVLPALSWATACITQKLKSKE